MSITNFVSLLQDYAIPISDEYDVEVRAELPKTCCDDISNHEMGVEFIYCYVCGRTQDMILSSEYRDPYPENRYYNNPGHSKPSAKRFYTPYTNLKDHLYRIMGGIVNPCCSNWNFGELCRHQTRHFFKRCNLRHRCIVCEGNHRVGECKMNHSWLETLVSGLSIDDRKLYVKIREKLKKLGMTHMYRNIYGIIYNEMQGHRPIFPGNSFENIKNDFRNIEHFHRITNGETERVRSLVSANLLLKNLLDKHGVILHYDTPPVKCPKARYRADKFYSDWIKFCQPKGLTE